MIVGLRRRFAYGAILYAGFVSAGAVLLVQTTLTHWRDPGADAVITAVVMLVPIGLAVSMNAVLLQSLVQLGSPPDAEGPVLVVYGTVTTIIAPIGGLLLGAAVDIFSTYWALTGCGAVMLVAALLLHRQFSVFDAIGGDERRPHPPVGHHWALSHLLGAEFRHGALAHLHHHRVEAGPARGDVST